VIDFTSSGTVSGKLKVNADGGAGLDVISATVGDVADRWSASFKLDGGHGDDVIDVTSSGQISGTLKVDADGGKGFDTISATSGAIAQGGSAAFSLDGGDGDDDIEFTSSGLLDGSLKFKADGGKGDDTIFADVTIDAASTGSCNAKVLRATGDDDLTFKVTDNTAVKGVSGLANFKAVIDGGKGNNTLTNTDNVTVVSSEIKHEHEHEHENDQGENEQEQHHHHDD